jgi:uncharacterized protein
MIESLMRLDLTRIRTAHEHFERVYPAETFTADRDGFAVVAPVSLTLDIQKDGKQFRLVGHVATTLELPCSRCVEPFRWPVDAAFDLRYLPQSSNRGDEERGIEEDDLSTAFYDDDEIDLAQLMREQFYLALPMKPLCGDECRGICPMCGTNLNRGACDCRRNWDDPRLAALQQLKPH